MVAVGDLTPSPSPAPRRTARNASFFGGTTAHIALLRFLQSTSAGDMDAVHAGSSFRHHRRIRSDGTRPIGSTLVLNADHQAARVGEARTQHSMSTLNGSLDCRGAASCGILGISERCPDAGAPTPLRTVEAGVRCLNRMILLPAPGERA